MRRVEVDEDVWEAVKAKAEPLEDDFNAVLRREFGLDSAGSRENGKRRAPAGSLLPMDQYEQPLLQALSEAGGRAQIRDVIDRVGELLGDRLTEEDRKSLPSGKQTRWRNRVQWAYFRLKKEGLLKEDTPRGIWEMTHEGHDRLRQDRAVTT